MEQIAYRIYGKANDMKTFKALDIQEGRLVNNLIYASLWYNLKDATNSLNDLKRQNSGIQFEIRKV